MHRIELVQEIPAPPDRVWAVYTDHEGWQRWAGIDEVVLRQQGYPPPNGLGAIRVIRHRGTAVEEEITAFESPKRMTYRLIAGAPIREHQGEVRLEPSGSGTRLSWNVEFKALIPGTGPVLRWVVERMLRRILTRLADYDFSA